GDDQHPHTGVVGLDRGGQGDAVHPGHLHVHRPTATSAEPSPPGTPAAPPALAPTGEAPSHPGRAAPRPPPRGRLSAGRHPPHPEPPGHPPAPQGLVVGEQHPDHRGTCTVSSNPCGSAARVRITAPAIRARSRSPRSPFPPPAPAPGALASPTAPATPAQPA